MVLEIKWRPSRWSFGRARIRLIEHDMLHAYPVAAHKR
jgi:hypothetical protein